MRRNSSWPSTLPEAISCRAASIIRRASSSRVRSLSTSSASAAKTVSRTAPGALSSKSFRPAIPRAVRTAMNSFLVSDRLMTRCYYRRPQFRLLRGGAFRRAFRVRTAAVLALPAPRHNARPMGIDANRVAGWIEGLARQPGEIADVFVERRHSLVLDWKDGEVIRARLIKNG